ncbi:MAG: hypothetical protein KAG97_05210 [Victivallales bacterium]|nr:hypothetical protein [Victivallales bacterium]
MRNIVIRECAAFTPFGLGIDPLWNALLEKRTAISPSERVGTSAFEATCCAEVRIPYDYSSTGSFVWLLMEPLREIIASWNSDHLVLATTKGEIDLLENEIRGNRAPLSGKPLCPLSEFLRKTLEFFGIPDGTVVSAACASSNIAVQRAAEMLLADRCKRPAVIGVDIVSKFVFSGFSALQALSPTNSVRPFDAGRNGLLLGEACAAALFEENDANSAGALATVAGWGASSDANHVTGPSRDGSGLAKAIHSALDAAGATPSDLSAVCAHGTGTVYNDAMEIMAFSTLMRNPVPAFSIKGATGHTMGAAGLLETLVCARALNESIAPPTVGLSSPDPLAEEWVSTDSAEIADGLFLNVNSGFGGVNAAIVLAP